MFAQLQCFCAVFCVFKDCDLVENEKRQMVLGVYMVWREGAGVDQKPEDVGVVIEGVTVLSDRPSVACACTMLLGLIYALDLSYPTTLQYTFEVFQKLLLNLDGHKLSDKVQKGQIKIYQSSSLVF